jgi:hypothetical protein
MKARHTVLFVDPWDHRARPYRLRLHRQKAVITGVTAPVISIYKFVTGAFTFAPLAASLSQIRSPQLKAAAHFKPSSQSSSDSCPQQSSAITSNTARTIKIETGTDVLAFCPAKRFKIPRPPKYSDACSREVDRKPCYRSSCKVVHDDHKELYKDSIADLPCYRGGKTPKQDTKKNSWRLYHCFRLRQPFQEDREATYM